MMRRPRTPHFIAGLGDGTNVMRQDNNKNHGDDFLYRRPPLLKGNVRKRPPSSPIIMRETASGSGDYSSSGDPLSEDGAWQISAIALLGIMGLLVALFLHLVTDGPVLLEQNKSRGTTTSGIRRRFSKQKKKTDEWSEDEQDDGNRADTESTSNHHAQQHQDQQQEQAPLYYPYQPRYQQQQHRHRKPSAGGYGELTSGSTGHSPLNSRPYYHHIASGSTPTPAKTPVYTAPSSSHRRQQQQQQQSPIPPVKASPAAAAVARKLQQDIGRGLEGFQQQQQQEDHEGGGGGGARYPIPARRPLSPISSFESVGMSQDESTLTESSSPFVSPTRKNNNKKSPLLAVPKGGGVLVTTTGDGKPSSSSLLLAPGTEDFVTPKVANVHKRHHFRQAQEEEETGIETAVTLSGSVAVGIEARLPFIPNLEVEDATSSETQSQPPLSDDSRSPVLAPQKPLLSAEELHLVRMETGELPPAWAVAAPSDKKKKKKSLEKKPKQAYPGHPNPKKSPPDAHQQQSATPTPQKNNPRNSIIHKRKNLTQSTDAGSSLMNSSIDFEELKLIEVIGGGGFGQVWKATWRGTPVAVKVLTGTAQTEFVSKSLLEEFAAEINMLKGMRHPNVCLYMGACLEPPNRAIITELAGNGSLWDALRLPLMAPYVAADGMTRDAWPLELYNIASPPFPPPGSWPWCLVKRVACGAARGMTYLHSGQPPVLHRDLKSANLLLDDSYTAKVCDFGLSRLKAQERSMTGNCGTVQWMAPEVLANKRYAEPADVYSFGIILWELLTRECPYEGMSAIQCALAVLNRNHRPVIPKWCPPALSALIEACLEKDPLKRPTFGQVILALDAMP